MKIIENLNLRHFSFLGTLILTIYALANREVSVFYMLYLFWWQALVEILTLFAISWKKTGKFILSFKLISDSLFLMGIYFVFIIVLFGFVFSYNNDDIMIINFQVLGFRNTTFNINIFLMLFFAMLNFNSEKLNTTLFHNTGVFSTRMIILHVSIILGAVLHFGSKHYLDESFQNTICFYMLSALPFLIIKSIFEWKKQL
ncbi:hypothetical protein [Halpernia sp.]|uniref:hypothetical protein n=1 Tax=Halpernia sp. TaxID=2782209 RepID=UPI003A8F5E56